MQQQISLNINEPKTLKIYDNGERATVICRMLRPGRFTSGISGKTFDITIDHLKLARAHYNGKLREYVKDIFRRELSEDELEIVQMSPVSAEHETHLDVIKGRIIGQVWIEEDHVTKKTWLMATLEILGAENVKKVQDGTYKSTSINFNTRTGEITELSFVFKPAIDDSCILSGNTPLSATKNQVLQLQTIVLSKENEYKNKIKEVDSANETVAQLREKIENAENLISFKGKLQGLVRAGKISKAEMKHILTATTNQDMAVFSGVTAALSSLETRAKRGKIYSTDDSFLKNLVTQGDNKVSTEAIKEVAAKLAERFGIDGNSNGQAQFSADKNIKTEVGHTQSAEHRIALKDSEEYKQHKAHLKAKGDKEGLKHLCKMAGDTDEDIEDKPTDKDKAQYAAEIKDLQDQLAAAQLKAKEASEDVAKFKAELDNATVELKAKTMALDMLNNFAGAAKNG